MSKMIVVEGPDCVGKSTFCELLLRMSEGKRKVAHCGIEMRGSPIQKYVSMHDPVLIRDRFHVSEYVYSNVCRGGVGPLADSKAFVACSEKLRSMGTFTVLIHASSKEYNELLDNFHARGELYTRSVCARVNKFYKSHVVLDSVDYQILDAWPTEEHAKAVLLAAEELI